MKYLKVIVLSVCISMLAFGCGASYKDGTYNGKYEDPKKQGYTTVEITIKDGKITDCIMESFDAKGNIKDENYGKEAGPKNYELAQIAVEGMKEYPGKLIETQDIEKVDTVSGATVTGKHFKEAVNDALSKAE